MLINLEQDILASELLIKKCQENHVYAQNLYAALCNNDFMKLDVWEILKDTKESMSWRHAGSVVSELVHHNDVDNIDYMEFYCSGISSPDDNYNINSVVDGLTNRTYVAEGIVTPEIEADLKTIQWIVCK